MDERQHRIIEYLIALAQADGRVADEEWGVIEGLMCSFDASEEQELQLSRMRNSPSQVPHLESEELSVDERELLMENAALLMRVDGVEESHERRMVERLSALLALPIPDRS